MNCPNCTAEMATDNEHQDYACPSCGLAGPLDVLVSMRAHVIAARDLGAEVERLKMPAVLLAGANPNAARLRELERLSVLSSMAGVAERENVLAYLRRQATGLRLGGKKKIANYVTQLVEALTRGDHDTTPERAAELEQDDADTLAAMEGRDG